MRSLTPAALPDEATTRRFAEARGDVVNEREQIPLPVDLLVTAQGEPVQPVVVPDAVDTGSARQARSAAFFTLSLEAVTPALFAHNQLRELVDERRENARAASLESR
jgi:hypothetical protein